MITLRHTHNPIDDILAVLDRLVKLDKGSAMQVADSVRAGYKENFSGQRAGDGGAWAPLAPFTQRDRARKGFAPARPILIRTGDYERGFTSPGHPEHIEEIEYYGDGLRIFVGSGDRRVKSLEEGTPFMPARPVVSLSTAAQGRVGVTIESIIDTLVAHGR